MNWALILIVSGSLQTVGYYATEAECQAAVKSANAQGVKALCVQQQSPEQAVAQMQRLMDQMIKGIDNRSRPVL